jgi:hypothetical protein
MGGPNLRTSAYRFAGLKDSTRENPSGVEPLTVAATETYSRPGFVGLSGGWGSALVTALEVLSNRTRCSVPTGCGRDRRQDDDEQ